MTFIGVVKTGVLTILVMISLVLSFLLWEGAWQSQPEIGIVSAVPLPVSKYPTLMQATAPVQAVYVEQGTQPKYSEAVPTTGLYTKALQLLQGLQVISLQQVSSIGFSSIADTSAKALLEVDFGTDLNKTALEQWIPGITTYELPVTASQVFLFTSSTNHTVLLGFISADTDYLSTTNITPNQFSRMVSNAVNANPWTPVSLTTESFVPSRPISVPISQWTLAQAQKTPLIHAFFTNPSALTNISKSDSTVGWTDGSRIVWLDSTSNQFLYEDPSISPATTRPLSINSAMTQAVIAYVRTHGGGLKQDRLLNDEIDSVPGLVASYSLRPFVHGYPVLDGSQDETLSFEQSHVTQFKRPLARISKEVKHRNVSVLDYSHLMPYLKPLVQAVPLSQITVQLGYTAKHLANGDVLLRPVYLLSEDGLPVWALDAVTGQMVKGVNQP